MPPDPVILAFDTSAAHCAVALFSGGGVIAHHTETMARGQAEHLFPLLEKTLSENNLTWQSLTALAVGVGPGNFTGVRISVSAARGLALSLNIPALGITSFDIMRGLADTDAATQEVISLNAPREQAYVQPFAQGKPQSPPQQIDPANPPANLARPGLIVRGYRAHDIAVALGANFKDAALTDIAQRIAEIAHRRLVSKQDYPAKPSPLYVRPADASPPRDSAPIILP